MNIVGSDGNLNAGFLKGIIQDAVNKNSWNLESGVFSLSDETTFGGKTLEVMVGELMPDVSEALNTALTSYDEILPFEKNAEDFRIFFKKFFEQQNTPVRKARTGV